MEAIMQSQSAIPAMPEAAGKDQEAMSRVVLAGMKLMYDPKTFEIFKSGLAKDQPIDDKLATQAAGLMQMMDDRAKGGIPRQVIAPAATMLLIEMARFMEESGMQGPTEDELKSAITKLLKIVLRVFGAGRQQGSAPQQAPQQQAMPAQPPQGLMQPQTMGA